MRIECPNCRRVSAISSDLIVTQRRAIELSCYICKADIHVQLAPPAEIKPDEAPGTSSIDSSTQLTSQIVETEEDVKIVEIKLSEELVEKFTVVRLVQVKKKSNILA